MRWSIEKSVIVEMDRVSTVKPWNNVLCRLDVAGRLKEPGFGLRIAFADSSGLGASGTSGMMFVAYREC